MSHLRFALILCAIVLCARAADDDNQEQQKPPTEIPDFSNLDEYVYQPKSTLNFGLRYLTGVKTKFWGNGIIGAPEALPSATGQNLSRTYHDGEVGPTEATVTVNNGDGTTTQVPATPNGTTNTWSYDSPSQYLSNGLMQYNLYSAVTMDNSVVGNTGKGNIGLEVYSARDLRNLTKHLSLKFFTGFSVNDIQSATMAGWASNITTVTDTYDLYGQTPQPAPYTQSGSSSTSQNTSTNSDVNGVGVSQTVDTTTNLSNAPVNRTTTSSVDSTTVTDHWKLHGAYATLRAGPLLVYNFNDHLHLDLGVGAALLYVGSTYQVWEVLNAPTGGEIIDPLTSSTSRVLPGYYVDATLQYDLTDTTGFYFGAFMQDAGSYLQTAESNQGSQYGDLSGTTGDYKTTVDFSDQIGLRTGLTFRF